MSILMSGDFIPPTPWWLAAGPVHVGGIADIAIEEPAEAPLAADDNGAREAMLWWAAAIEADVAPAIAAALLAVYEQRLRDIPLSELRDSGFQSDDYHEEMRGLFIRALNPATKWKDES